MDEYFIQQNTYDMFYGSHERRLIFGVIQSPEEALNDPQFSHRGYFDEIQHPTMGMLNLPGAPFIMESTPWETIDPAPTVGQHNSEVLARRLGYTAEYQAELRSQGVI